MSDVFVANATRQHHNFMYNIKGRSSSTTQIIPMGGQIKISGDLLPDDLEGIVLQHEPYGFCSMDELGATIRRGAFGGLFYNVGAPIPEETIIAAMNRVTADLDKMGQETRKAAAVTLPSEFAHKFIGENNPQGGLKGLEMTMEEQPPPAGLAEGQVLKSEGIKVVTGPTDAPKGKGSK